MLKDSKFTEIDEEFICEHCGKIQNLKENENDSKT